ncbi:hypothetical protein GLA29479_1717 [Lysobacter antibioticus]|nr:hypothetical protein GLA29479_1717 [Lysobacter antibioticus]
MSPPSTPSPRSVDAFHPCGLGVRPRPAFPFGMRGATAAPLS